MFILLNISKFVMKQLISNQRVSCLYQRGGRVKKTAFFVLWDFISIFLSHILSCAPLLSLLTCITCVRVGGGLVGVLVGEKD